MNSCNHTNRGQETELPGTPQILLGHLGRKQPGTAVCLPWIWGALAKRFHGQLAKGAKHKEGIFLQSVREPSDHLMSLCVRFLR